MRVNILARPYQLSCFNRAVVSVHRVHCSQYRMQYTLESFHDVEKNISDVFDTVLSTAKCKKLDEITERAFVNLQLTKNLLASVIVNLVGVMDNA